MAIRNTGDRSLVTEAAAALDTSEIAVFRGAWWHWSGRAPDEGRLEAQFITYMFGGSVPVWVRGRCSPLISFTIRRMTRSASGGTPARHPGPTARPWRQAASFRRHSNCSNGLSIGVLAR